MQRGFRGQNSVELFSEKTLAQEDEINKLSKPLRAATPEGPKAADIYENVHVLGDLSRQQFARTMLSIKAWVAPDQGCNYCHNAPNYASDEKYTKRVAREMLRMTRHINTDWTAHVAATGVTCYTCHRGQPVPAKTWFSAPDKERSGETVARGPVRLPTASAGNTVLPVRALDDYLLHDDNVRIVGGSALQSGNRHSVLQARDNLRADDGDVGITGRELHVLPLHAGVLQLEHEHAAACGRLVRDPHGARLEHLGDVAADRSIAARAPGAHRGVPKIYCATCHRGSNKPLYGVPMIKDYPELVSPTQPTSVSTTSVPPPPAPGT